MKLSSPKKKLSALYARVSSQQQKDEETIDSQIDTLLKFAIEKGYEIPPDLIFKDDGYSGSSLDRPQLDNLRDFAREGCFDTIFVYSPDRLARRYACQIILDEEFRKLDIKLIYLKGGSKTDSAEDVLLAQFQGIFAEYERAQILDRTRRGKLYKAKQGIVTILPKASFGYHKERDTSFYTIKESEMKIVKEIFHLFTKDRLTLRKICRQLEENGVSAPQGGLKWDPKTVKGILNNTAYIGTVYFGKTEKYEGNIKRIARYSKKGKIIQPIKAKKMRSKDLWAPIAVPQFINESDFELAQELLKKNKEFAKRNTKEPSILQGLLVCGICGKSYYKKRRVKNGKNSTYYSCHSRLLKDATSCGNKNIKQEVLDKQVWDSTVELLHQPDLILHEISRRCNVEKESHRKIDLENELKQIDNSLNKLLDAYQEGDCLTLDELRKRSKKLKEKQATLNKEIAAIEADSIREKSLSELQYTLEAFKQKLDDSFEKLSIEKKQLIMRALIEDIVIFPDEVEVKHIIPLTGKKCPLSGVFGE